MKLEKTNTEKIRDLSCLVYFVLAVSLCSTAGAAVITFDELPLPQEGFWNGSDQSGGFTSSGAWFNNYYEDYGFGIYYWESFSYSDINDTITSGFTGQYNAITGAGQGGSPNYAVCFAGWLGTPVMTFEKPHLVYGLSVTNNNYTYYSMLNGGGGCKKFGGTSGNDPDWFLLTITGIDAQGVVTGAVNFYLADYRFTDHNKDYIVNTWQYVDLTSLGEVKSLQFTLSSSDTGSWGMNTPAYFALDTIKYQYDQLYTEEGINGYIDPGNNCLHADPQDANAVINPIFKGWTSAVAAYHQTPGVDTQWSNPAKTLGHATGDAGDIFSLGELSKEQILRGESPGWITLYFDEPIRNKKGYDFAVFENGTISQYSTPAGSTAGQLMAELAYVDVSSNGINFVRFPSVSLTSQSVGPYGTIDPCEVRNLAGKHPNSYNLCTGTPFDLEEIIGDPNVVSGLVDINDIRFVRIVDIPGTGDFYDEAVKHIDPNSRPDWKYYKNNHPIFDAWPTWGSGGFDLEAVGALNEQQYSADIDLNGIVDKNDFALFASAWHSHFGEPGYIARCDLAEPKDKFIDINDLAVFMSQWQRQEKWHYKN